MTVAQLLEALATMPRDAVVLMENGGGLSLVSGMEFTEPHSPGQPAEILLLPNMDE